MPPEDSGTRSGFWKTGLGYLTQIGILLGAIAGILAGVTQLTGGDDDPAAVKRETPIPRLAVLDLAVSGGRQQRCLTDRPDPQRLDVTVRNTGDQPAAITRLGLRIRATGMLTIPQAGGGLEPSRNYDVLLPPDPRAGQLVRYKLSQEVAARANDRFTVRMDQPEPERQLGVRLYQLEILLFHDAARTPLSAGTALVATPYLPDKFFFPAGLAPDQRAGYEGSEPLRTMEDNEATLRRMLALDGERAPGLNADLVDVPVTGKEPTPCLPSGKRRPVPSAQAPLSEP